MAGPGMHQSQNLSLQQVLAPQLQQSLLILQAPLLELRNLVQQEMETNPVLEELATDPTEETAEKPAEPERRIQGGVRSAGEAGRRMARLHGAVEQLQRAVRRRRRKAPILLRFDRDPGDAAAASDGAAQPDRARCNDRKTAELIIGNIDDNGFLQIPRKRCRSTPASRRKISRTCSR